MRGRRGPGPHGRVGRHDHHDDAAASAEEAVWPPPGHARYADPVRAVRSFLEEYLGHRDPPLSAFRGSAPSAGEVDVYLVGEGGDVRRDRVVSTVAVQESGGDWAVTGARTGEIVVESPKPGETVGSPVVVAGRGSGFEGTILVALLDAPAAAGSVAEGIAAAGSGEELRPFRVELTPARGSSRPTGALLLSSDTGCDSCNSSFAVVPVRFGPAITRAAPAGETATVEVWWVDGSGRPVRATRDVDRSRGVLRGAVLQLLSGPYGEEREAGLATALAGPVGWRPSVDVSIRDGLAVVDFRENLAQVSPGTSASAASERFLRQLHATVFQFPTVTRAEYRLGGSCEAFWSWLGRSCTTVDRGKLGI